MYSSYSEAGEGIILAIEQATHSSFPLRSEYAKQLADLLRTDTASSLHRADFMTPERVVRCLKGEAPVSICASMKILFPRSFKFVEEAYMWAARNRKPL